MNAEVRATHSHLRTELSCLAESRGRVFREDSLVENKPHQVEINTRECRSHRDRKIPLRKCFPSFLLPSFLSSFRPVSSRKDPDAFPSFYFFSSGAAASCRRAAQGCHLPFQGGNIVSLLFALYLRIILSVFAICHSNPDIYR